MIIFSLLASYTAKLLRDCIEFIAAQRETEDQEEGGEETESLLQRSSSTLPITYGDVGMEVYFALTTRLSAQKALS
jgi:hypothetical protein